MIKKILLLGSGYVAGPCAEYLLRRPENHLTVASRRIESAKALCPDHPNAHPLALDVNNQQALEAAVAEHDLVISLVPYTHHADVIKAAIKHKRHVVTQIGVDPGVDHLWALKTIWETHEAGGKILHFTSYCGGLPAPECSNNPLGYKFSWSSRGVLLALRNEAKFIENGQKVVIPGPQLLKSAKPIWTGYPAWAFEGYPNRDSTPYDKRYGIPEAQTIIRGTLRYAGFPEFMQAMVDIGFLDDSHKDFLAADAKPLSWRSVLTHVLGLSGDASDDDLNAAVAVKAQLAANPDALKRVIAGMRWIGMFSKDTPAPLKGTPLDVLCTTLNAKMQYGPGERDLVFLQHRFEIETKDGEHKTITSTLVEYGTEKASAMAKTVGVPYYQRGVLAPMNKEIVFPLMEELIKEGINMEEVEY
ncbi:saccharopine dehydrogenase [Catenaria anguillulae PL171]|uniref:Saccharopine dehydrogenase n=1 Tax=Catenaria anguillulae PL171 TaxID=765915 RepID=A0A1Y2HP85_9FUNG|nr:saccharopine dehydrogenase [Catenaria anguillulae PL171]